MIDKLMKGNQDIDEIFLKLLNEDFEKNYDYLRSMFKLVKNFNTKHKFLRLNTKILDEEDEKTFKDNPKLGFIYALKTGRRFMMGEDAILRNHIFRREYIRRFFNEKERSHLIKNITEKLKDEKGCIEIRVGFMYLEGNDKFKILINAIKKRPQDNVILSIIAHYFCLEIPTTINFFEDLINLEFCFILYYGDFMKENNV